MKKVKLNEEIQQKLDCPYINTIKRHLLDFDFEKLCSISLNNTNVYACLVCGKYYQGKTKNTYAYTHSLEFNHHLFMNLSDSKIYCLPDLYEVIEESLVDIQFNLNPIYTQDRLKQLDQNIEESRALDGSTFLPGYVGLNNLGKTDYCNVILQSLCRVKKLRDFLIFYDEKNTTLTQSFSELFRKIWNDRNYKGHVSPHELLQCIAIKSDKQFQIGKQSDPINFIAWIMNSMKRELGQCKIIQECFEGQLQIEWFRPLINAIGYEQTSIKETKPFYFLTLDIPQVPLHKAEKAGIPHIPIETLLKKFDGQTNKDSSDGRRRFQITKFPKYIIVHMKRFMMNNFFMEKNPTIVSFPLHSLDLGAILGLNKQLKYNLVANVCHEGNAKVGFYKVHVKNLGNGLWYQIQDLHTQIVVPELISVSEAYIQIYEQQ
ncbi:hypothetical protein pb186bvf_016320 [Paramecium bursaria]